MQIYKIGKIVSVNKIYIVLQSQDTGWMLYVANTQTWMPLLETNAKVYLYEYKSEYMQAWYGFHTFSERILFQDLINVSGVGPRTALNILRGGEHYVIELIANADLDKLTQLPQVGSKIAQQIVHELQVKYEQYASRTPQRKSLLPIDIKPSLKTLGFSTKQIDYAIENISPEASAELMVEKAIKLIAHAKLN